MSLPPSKRGAVHQEGDSVPAFLRVGENRPANLRGEIEPLLKTGCAAKGGISYSRDKTDSRNMLKSTSGRGARKWPVRGVTSVTRENWLFPATSAAVLCVLCGKKLLTF